MSAWIVSTEQAGTRLDRLAAELSGESRHRIVAGIEAGEVRVDGRRGKKGQPVEAGQRITVELASLAPVPEPERALQVVHEDPAFVVVEKPAGLPTHPLRPGETGTLAGAVVARYPECVAAGGSEREGGAAHRLDAPTSGLVLFARNRAAWDDLRGQFAARTVE
jgi:23S rRNA pseudouridine1911/1915/1917 synthase